MITEASRERIIAGLGFMPAPMHAALIRVALAVDDDLCLAAWAAWQALDIAPDALDEGSRRLMPAAFARLMRAKAPDMDLGRMRGLHRRALYWYQLMAHRAGEATAALLARGIPVMLLKGAALVARYRLDPGSRPMGDVDLAVPRDRASEALAVLDALPGWRTSSPIPHERALASAHARGYQHRDRFGVDLHWHLLVEATWPGADETFWDGALPLRWQGRDVVMLSPTDQLFHGLVHDAAHDRAPSPHVLLDAAHVLRSDQIDGRRLVALAARYRQVMTLQAALRALAAFGLGLPEVERELARVPVSLGDALYHWLRTPRLRAPSLRVTAPARVLATWWFRRGRERGPLSVLGDLPQYLHARYAARFVAR